MAERSRASALTHPILATVVDALADHDAVVAIALGGSRAAGAGDPASDLDLCVVTDGEVPLAPRRALAERFGTDTELDTRWFGTADLWTDTATGVLVDLSYFDRDWLEGRLRDPIERHIPAAGYTTAFWFTVLHAEPLFDRDGWLAAMQRLARTPYPEGLVAGIIAYNRPLLRGSHTSFRNQIALAAERGDLVSIQHRVTALLASVFDIVFALDRSPHPGEKRLLAKLAATSAPELRALDGPIRAVIAAGPDDALRATDRLCDAVDRAVAALAPDTSP